MEYYGANSPPTLYNSLPILEVLETITKYFLCFYFCHDSLTPIHTCFKTFPFFNALIQITIFCLFIAV